MKIESREHFIHIRKEGRRIAEEYAYLDTMPLGGWAWEFIRRSDRYKREYDKIRNAAEKSLPEEQLASLVYAFHSWASKAGIHIPLSVTSSCQNKPLEEAYHLWIKLPRANPPEMPFDEYPELNGPYAAIPHPNAKFTDIPSESMFVSPWRASLKRSSFEDDFLQGSVCLGNPADLPSGGPGFTIYPSFPELAWGRDPDLVISEDELPDQTVYEYLSDADDSKDMVYIAISRDAFYTELKRDLLPTLKKYLNKEKPRIQATKWKYYVTIYDLKERYGASMSDEDIAQVLVEAYPEVQSKTKKASGEDGQNKENSFNPNNCERNYATACSLINGGYKKYLL